MANKKYEDALQTMVNLSYDELVERGKYTLGNVMPALNNIAKDGNGSQFLITILGTCVAVDGKITGYEHQFINDTLGLNISFENMKATFEQFYNEDAIALTNKIAHALTDDERVQLAIFCTCLLAVDQTIAKVENAFIQMLLS